MSLALPLTLGGNPAAARADPQVRRTRRKRETKKVDKKEKELPQVVTCSFSDNQYTGIIKDGHLGLQHLEGSVSYSWTSGIKYEGAMAMSEIEGFGKLTWPDGSRYEGSLHQGMRHGQGVYIAKDGHTRYSGQWHMGRRHGFGELVYPDDSAASYEGYWQDGKKHGHGKQVWPSGNVYEGEWEAGKMSGQGSMTWRQNSATYEQYSGTWHDNLPHGEGTHTWHAPDPKPVQTAKEWPSQQMNNRYSGQWCRGQRNGFGTFYYANGSYYRGEWKDHQKHGSGRQTFEDGRFYEGDFAMDQMTGSVPKDMLLPPLSNFGNEDNPMRRCIDITDLKPFALPADHSGFPMSSGVGYQSIDKIFRELYNMLLRHLGELKELYFRYRVVNPRQGSDPFMLEARQLWLLWRDAGIASPSCPLSLLDRMVFNGPRHHGEVAPEDLTDLRLLTPRARTPSPEPSVHEGDDESEDDSRPPSQRSADRSDDGSSVVSSVSHSRVGVSTRRSRSTASNLPDVAEIEDEEDPEVAEDWNAKPAQPDASLEAVVAGNFTRAAEGCTQPSDIHAFDRPLMFRHYIESIVRLSVCRFPVERGMEPQLRRLLSEAVITTVEAHEDVEDVFGFLNDSAIQETWQELGPELLRHVGGATTDEARLDAPLPYGSSKRRFVVNARQETTFRLKDVFRLLRNAGLLKPMLCEDIPQAGEEAAHGPVLKFFPDDESSAKDEGETDADTKSAKSSPRLRASVADRFSMNRGYTYSRFSVSGRGGLGAFDVESVMDNDAATRKDDETEAGTEAGGKGDLEQSSASAANPLADLTQFDFSLTVLEVLVFVTEVLNFNSLDCLRWQFEPKTVPSHGYINLMEYMEVDLTFIEFFRLLLRIAERAAPPVVVRGAGDVPVPALFDAMLRQIVLPSLGWTPLGSVSSVMSQEAFLEASLDTGGASTETPLPAEKVEEEVAQQQLEETQGDVAAEDTQNKEPVEGEPSKEEPPPPPPPAALWYGFSDGNVMSVGTSQRRWPTSYLEAVAAWD
mmetsp:Transcript_54551/g.127513  ORF Transcript_54551/g.127513 Transcript_54551/m.127513 type:complete len:1021 (-) Transcript_54551:70-3132(-)